MKAPFCMVSVLAFTLSGMAQGTVTFNNRVAGTVVTHVYAPSSADPRLSQIGNGSNDTVSGATTWAAYTPIGLNGTGGQFGGATTFAQLLAAPGSDQPFSSLVPASPVVSFRSGAAAGFVAGMTAELPNVAPDATVATVVMVAWDNSTGLYPTWVEAYAGWLKNKVAVGESNPLNLFNIGGNINTPPTLAGLQSFNLYLNVPEPPTLALLGLGGVVLALRGSRRGARASRVMRAA